ncbi:MAG TPA: hypothetical protein VH396_05935 [Chitinophagaceae bacterium]
MKNNFFNVCVLILCITIGSCKKNGSSDNHKPPGSGRTIRFLLYTDHDFSNDNSVIHFYVFIKKGSVYVFDTTRSNLLFDSAFVPIQAKNIPDSAHKIVVEKKVVGYDDADLTAGFIYQIENVGSAWHIDTSRAGNPLKVIDYNFR